MTDAPDGPAEGEPERGARRGPRTADSGGSPVGSTLSIVLAVIAVIAGFLVLRAITDDDGDGGGGGATPDVTTPGTGTGTGTGSSTPATGTGASVTQPGVAKSAATVVVANASGIGGTAAAMTAELTAAGYTMATPGDASGDDLATSVVYYVDGDPNALAVAGLVAADMGGIQTAVMPIPPPIDQGMGAATVLVLVGTDTANKPLTALNPAGAVTAPPAVGATATTTG